MIKDICILGAMDIEIKGFLESFNFRNNPKFDFPLYECELDGKKIILAKSGVGKVFSAITCQKIIDSFEISSVVMTGVAGALRKDLEVGDVVVGKTYIQHDVDCEVLGLKRGLIPDTSSREFFADKQLVDLAVRSRILDRKIISGIILSGDQFLSEKDTLSKNYLFDDMHGDVIDMECAAVAQVCNFNKVSFVGIKTVCTKLEGNQEEQYRESLTHVVDNSIGIVKSILEI